MALPIKANDTQEGCNPIASNCVIWQGPDIPCIKLCKGDTISDVSAKLAERLCTILDYLQVSAYDLTCFNPVCPSPKDFQDLIQLLIDRICAINDIVNPTNGGGSGGSGVGCPDCIIPVATCLQKPDALGNITATLQLKDYVILIGNEICNITTSLAAIDSRVTSLEAAVTDIQTNCCTGGGTGGDLTMPASICIGTGAGTPVIDYLVALDAAFCTLQTSSGTQNDTNTALSYKCINGSDTLPSGTGTWNSIPGWIDSPTNIAQAVQDLWLIVCEQNQTIIDLQTQITECCEGSGPPAPSCTEIQWSMTRGSMVKGTYWGIVPTFSGSIPAGWTYASGAGATVTITDNGGNTYENTYDLINWINNPSAISSSGFLLGSGPSGVSYSSTHYTVTITLQLINGSTTCTSTSTLLVTNTLWCSDVLASASYLTNNGVTNVAAPRISIGTPGPLASGANNDIPTNYTITITPVLSGPSCTASSFPTLTGQFLNWEGPIGTLVTGVPLPATAWTYGTPSPAAQSWNYPNGEEACLDSATGIVVVQQGDKPSITCNIVLVPKAGV